MTRDPQAWLTEVAAWVVRTEDQPGDSVSSPGEPRAHDPLCRPTSLLLRGMGLDGVQRDVEPRANLAPQETRRDASQHRDTGRAGLLDALSCSACSGRSSEFAAGRAEADAVRGP